MQPSQETAPLSRAIRVEHPLIEHHLCAVRDLATRPNDFRASVRRISMILAAEATRDLEIRPRKVTTPLCETNGYEIASSVVIVPILRAGLGMVDPLLDLLPDASVWHLGLYRNESTAQPVGYYDKLPPDGAPDVALVVDPMLATGGSVDLVVRRLQQWGVGQIRVLSIIASQPGVDRVSETFPDVRIFVAAVDPELNDQAFIVPGLGDAGDRIFDTPQQG